MAVTIPDALLRGVLGNPHARGLLELLAGREEPIRYSEARDALGLHPEAFQRALGRLETFALVQMRAPEQAGRKPASVHLEASSRGRKLAKAWQRMQAEYARALGAEAQGLEKAARGRA